MATARFTGTEEEQFEDTGGDESQESQDWPDLDDPKRQAATQGEGETSKSEGKTGDQPSQAEGGAQAPPKENHLAPKPSEMRPGPSKDPRDPPAIDPTQDPTQASTQNPEEETPPILLSISKVTSRQGRLTRHSVSQ